MQTIRWPSASLGTLIAAVLLAGACTEWEPAGPEQSTGPSIQPSLSQSAGPGRRSRQVIGLKGVEGRDFESAVRALGGRVERRHPEIGVVTVTGLSDAAARTLAARADVAEMDADVAVRWIPRPEQMFRQAALPANRTTRPSAPGTDQSGAAFFDFQWNLQVIRAPEAWAATPAGEGRLVCVLDTGVDPGHVDLAGRIDLSRSASFVEGEPTIQDFNTHGTFVSSLITSNGLGIASVASDGTLCAVKVLDTEGSGSFDDVIAGILFATKQGADVINMSLGAYVDLREPGVRRLVRQLQRAVDFARWRGVVVVVSAGNDGINLDKDSRDSLTIPAQLDNVISVGATGPIDGADFDRLASYSNFGGRTGIALVAPGGDFVTENVFDLVLGACSSTQVVLPFTCGTTSFVFGDGTSFASPHVAAAAAVVASRLGSRRDQPGHITECILEGAADVGPSRIFGAGRLDVADAATCRSDKHHRKGWQMAER